ncbi:MAG: Fructose-bisphosphate aldolase class I, partial [uncultured Acetobacteraceae bacterium]
PSGDGRRGRRAAPRLLRHRLHHLSLVRRPVRDDGGAARAGRGGQVGGPRRGGVELPARPGPRQEGRDRARHLRLRRAHRGAARRAHHQGEAADGRDLAGRGEEDLREVPGRAPAPSRAHPPRRPGLLQRPTPGGVLRRRDRHHREHPGDHPRHPRGRRQRLHHRPQHLPAPARRGARPARPSDRHLRGQVRL